MVLGLKGSAYSSFGWFGISCPGSYDIHADSAPDHDQWGPDCAWSAQDWINWHKAMIAQFGKPEADNRWVIAYDKSTYGSKEIGYSTGNPEFKAYALSNGLDKKSTILSKVYKAENALDAAGEPIRNIGGAINNATQAAETATESANTLFQWVPFIVVAFGLLFAFLVYQKKSFKAALI